MLQHNKSRSARVAYAAKGWFPSPIQKSKRSQGKIRGSDGQIVEVQGASAEVFQQIGAMTKHILSTMKDIGVMPKLEGMAQELPDARSRLNYIVEKTTNAANIVLNAVDEAKEDQQKLIHSCKQLETLLQTSTDPEIQALIVTVTAKAKKVDSKLTDIMMAQDFHDLTGQVVKKVVALAVDLEDNLVKLFMQVVPPEEAEKARTKRQATEEESPHSHHALHGPVVASDDQSGVAQNQADVDDLLASLGF